MRPREVTGSLLGVVIAVQLVALLVLLQSSSSRFQAQAGRAALHFLDIEATKLVFEAQQFLLPVTTQLLIGRQLTSDGLLDTDDSAVLEQYFLSQLRSNAAIKAMYLGRFDGSFVSVARFEQSFSGAYIKPVLRAKLVRSTDDTREVQWREYSLDGKRLDQWTNQDNVDDPRVISWFEEVQKYDEPVWTNAFTLTGTNRPAVAASVNLVDSKDQDAGVLGVSVDLAILDQHVKSMQISHGASAVMVDADLNQVVSIINENSQPEKALGAAVSLKQFLPPDAQGGSSLSTSAKQWVSDESQYVHVQREIDLFDGALQWRVLMKAPVSQFKPIGGAIVKDGLYGMAVVVIVPGLIALLIVFGMNKPLRRLYHRATIDYLTRAYNRDEFMSLLTRHVNVPDRGLSRQTWVVAVLDLDGFKQINDQHGHDAGDEILKSIVARLQKQVGKKGFVGRLGGDEFALAVKVMSGVDAKELVELIRSSVVKDPVRHDSRLLQVGMTAGIATNFPQGEPVISLLERADRALIAGKSISKNATYSGSSASLRNMTASGLQTVKRMASTPRAGRTGKVQ